MLITTILTLIFLLTPLSASADDYESQTSPGVETSMNPYETYSYLRMQILKHVASVDNPDRFRTVVNDDKKVRTYLHFLYDARLASRQYEIFMKAEPNPDVLYCFLKKALQKMLDLAALSETAGRRFAWKWGFLGDAAVIAYQRTGEERFLDLIVSTYDAILRFRDSETGKVDEVRDRVTHSWSSMARVKLKETQYKRLIAITTTGLITYPVCKFCQIILNDGILQAKYAHKAKEYLETVEEAVAELDEDFRVTPGTDEGSYVRPVTGEVEAWNHEHAIGTTLVLLHSLTGKQEYKKKAEHMARYFLNHITRERNGSYVWSYRPLPNKRYNNHDSETYKKEAIWKGGVTIMFPIIAYEHGIVFDENDMKALTQTFLKNIYRGGNKFNRYVSLKVREPLLSETRAKKYRRRVQSLVRWIYLDKFEPEIREILEDAVATRLDLFPNGWFGHPALVQAYAYRLPVKD